MNARLSIALVCAASVACGGEPTSRRGTPDADAGAGAVPVPAPAPTLAAPFVVDCTDGDEAVQRHGSTCLCCHSEFGVAGSIDRDGPPLAKIIVTDAHGETARLSPNRFGNFFRHFTLTPPFRASVLAPDGRTLEMKELAPTADCNACHRAGESVGLVHGP